MRCHRLKFPKTKSKLRSIASVFLFAFQCIAVSCLAVSAAHAQFAFPEKEIRVNDLPSVTARASSKDGVAHSSDLLAAALEMVLRDEDACCGKDSALEDALQAVDAKSLKDIAERLQGRHVLGDGRVTTVTAEFLAPDQVTAPHIVAMMHDQHAALMMWNSHLYVLYGVTYVESADTANDAYNGMYVDAIHKFLLQDVRYADSRRKVVFDRLTEDLSKVQGVLFLSAKTE